MAAVGSPWEIPIDSIYSRLLYPNTSERDLALAARAGASEIHAVNLSWDPVLRQATMHTRAPHKIIDRSKLTMPRGIPCDTVLQYPLLEMLGPEVEAQSNVFSSTVSKCYQSPNDYLIPAGASGAEHAFGLQVEKCL